MSWTTFLACRLSISRFYFCQNLVLERISRDLYIKGIGFTFLTVLDCVYGPLVGVVISFMGKDGLVICIGELELDHGIRCFSFNRINPEAVPFDEFTLVQRPSSYRGSPQ